MHRQSLSNFAVVLLLLAVFGLALVFAGKSGTSANHLASVDKTAGSIEVESFQFAATAPEDILLDDASQNCLDFESIHFEARSMWGGGLQRRIAPKDTQLRANLIRDPGANSSLFVGTIFDGETFAQNMQELEWQLMPQPIPPHKDLAFGIRKSNVTDFMRSDLPERLKETIDELDNAQFTDQSAKLRKIYNHVSSDVQQRNWERKRLENQVFYFGGVVAGR